MGVLFAVAEGVQQVGAPGHAHSRTPLHADSCLLKKLQAGAVDVVLGAMLGNPTCVHCLHTHRSVTGASAWCKLLLLLLLRPAAGRGGNFPSAAAVAMCRCCLGNWFPPALKWGLWCRPLS